MNAQQKTLSPTQPQRVAMPLQVGELVLLRKPDSCFDVKAQLCASTTDSSALLSAFCAELLERDLVFHDATKADLFDTALSVCAPDPFVP